MRTKLLPLYIFSLCLMLASCEKPPDLPPDSEEAVVLTMSCTIDNNKTVDFAAGKGSDFSVSFKYYPYFDDSIFAFCTTIEDTNRTGKGSFTFVVWSHQYPAGNYNEDLEASVDNSDYQYEYILMPYRNRNVRIEWQTNDSTYFTSDCISQPTGTFNISEVETLVKDGVKYRKGKISFSCRMKNPMTGETHQVDGTGVLAFQGERI